MTLAHVDPEVIGDSEIPELQAVDDEASDHTMPITNMDIDKVECTDVVTADSGQVGEITRNIEIPICGLETQVAHAEYEEIRDDDVPVDTELCRIREVERPHVRELLESICELVIVGKNLAGIECRCAKTSYRSDWGSSSLKKYLFEWT